MNSFVKTYFFFGNFLLPFIIAEYQNRDASQEVLQCFKPLKYFVHCISSEYKHRLDGILLEKNRFHRRDVQQCFDKYACTDINLESNSVGLFLTGAWKNRVRTFLGLLESTPSDVQSCMLTYVKGIVQDQFQKCVRDFGPNNLHNFSMPEIPGFDDFDVVAAKEVIQYRMLVRHGVLNCVKRGKPVHNLIDCIANTRVQFAKSMCTVRNECKKAWMDRAGCGDHFDQVHSAACECRAEERKQLSQTGIFGYLHRLHALVKKIDTLKFEDNYKLCFQMNNRTFPEEQFEVMKKVLAESVADVILFKKHIPTEVRYTLKVAQGVLSNLGQNWRSSFCTECHREMDTYEDKEMNNLRLLAENTKKKIKNSPPKTFSRKPMFYNLFKGLTSFIRLT